MSGFNFSMDWTSASVMVAVAVFVFDVIDKKSTRRATRLLITEYLALDLSALVHQARELGMYVALHTPAVHTKVSRSDRYLSDGAMALGLPTIERHADSLATLPSELTNAVALCMAHIRDLQEQVYLLTSDEPLGRHYPSASEGRDRTNRAAATLMKAAERALEVADRVRVNRGD